jgi:hypothetical protein
MASDEMARSRVTPYLIYLVFITTLGPLQFGYHLVSKQEDTSWGYVSIFLTSTLDIIGGAQCTSSSHHL